MYNSLDSISFLTFGSVYDAIGENIKSSTKCLSKRIKDQNPQPMFYQFDCEMYIEVQSGNGILLVSNDPLSAPIVEFAISRPFCIKSGVYFSIIPASTELELDLYIPEGYALKMASLNRPYDCQLIHPQIQVTEFFRCFYNVLTSSHKQLKECHSFYELVFVDTGVLHTKIGGKDFVINEK